MSEMACACPHQCDPPCLRCLAGWHTDVCGTFTLQRVNARLDGRALDGACGRCGARRTEHS